MKNFFLMIVLFALNGCVPKMHTTLPAIEGKVVDAVTHTPLSGVEVGGEVTNKNGEFYLDGEKTLGVGTPMGGVWKVPVVYLKVSKEGYHSMSCQCESFSTQDGCLNVEIVLIPLQKKIDKIELQKEETGFSCQLIE